MIKKNLILFFAIILSLYETTSAPLTVNTTTAHVTGFLENNIRKFHGIKFGKVNKRFSKSEPENHMGSVFANQTIACPQNPIFQYPFFVPLNLAVDSRIIPNTENEDCLYLDIETREELHTNCAVLINIHPGAYATGSGSNEIFKMNPIIEESEELCIIYVSINRRLNIGAFFDLNGIDNETELHMDAGLYDVVLGIQWIRNNIGNFGGDPDNLILYGESGGGAVIYRLLVENPWIELSKSGVNRAIISSAAPVNGFPRDLRVSNSLLLASQFNCTQTLSIDILNCVRNVSYTDLLFKAIQLGIDNFFQPAFGNGANYPTGLIQQLKDGNFDDDVDIFLGFNNREGHSFLTLGSFTPPPFTTQIVLLNATIDFFLTFFGFNPVNENYTDLSLTGYQVFNTLLVGSIFRNATKTQQIMDFYKNLPENENLTLWELTGRAYSDGEFHSARIMAYFMSDYCSRLYVYNFTHEGQLPLNGYNFGGTIHAGEIPFITGNVFSGYNRFYDSFSQEEIDFSQKFRYGFIQFITKSRYREEGNGKKLKRYKKSKRNILILEPSSSTIKERTYVDTFNDVDIAWIEDFYEIQGSY